MNFSDDFLKSLAHINFETELLEALNWDESELSRLQNYLNNDAARGQNVEKVLNEIELEFGKSISEILRKLFGEMIFSYNLHTRGHEIEN